MNRFTCLFELPCGCVIFHGHRIESSNTETFDAQLLHASQILGRAVKYKTEKHTCDKKETT